MRLNTSTVFAATAALFFSATAHADSVGSWTFYNPDSAVLIEGGEGDWGFLNVAFFPIGVNEAFTDTPMSEKGYANGSVGTIIEVTFDGGVVNGEGDDLVMLEARFDAGSFDISSEYDGFETTASPTFEDTEVDHTYGFDGAGPYIAGVFGGGIDLSNLGVPDGETVHTFRFTTTNAGADPLGLAAIIDDPELTVVGTCPGVVTVDVTGVASLATVVLAAGSEDSGFAVPSGACAGEPLEVGGRVMKVTSGEADLTGSVSFELDLPEAACGWYVEALDMGLCSSTQAEIFF
jgi:hypothetical protein